jgi:H+-translocating NAD(P) transhydrogenase subunit alpha
MDLRIKSEGLGKKIEMSDSNMIVDQAASVANAAQELAQQAAGLALAASNAGASGGGNHADFLLMGLTILVLACFVGYHVVWRVTPALHSPLMAITNAISSVIVVGALMSAGLPDMSFAKLMGFIAVTLAAVNIFGGFIVTRRMLHMFKKRA